MVRQYAIMLFSQQSPVVARNANIHLQPHL